MVEIINNELTECLSFYPENKPLVINANRGQDVELTLDRKSQRIRYKKFVYNENTGFYTSESENVSLIFEGGKFVVE